MKDKYIALGCQVSISKINQEGVNIRKTTDIYDLPLPLCDFGKNHRQPLFTVQSSRAIHIPVKLTGVV